MIIARHFPTLEDVSAMALFRHSSRVGYGTGIARGGAFLGRNVSAWSTAGLNSPCLACKSPIASQYTHRSRDPILLRS